MVSRKPVPPSNGAPPSLPAGSNRPPYPVTPSSPRVRENPFGGGDGQLSDNAWSFDNDPNAEITKAYPQKDAFPNQSDIIDGWVDAGDSGREKEDQSTLPPSLRISNKNSAEFVEVQPHTSAPGRPDSLQVTPRSSWETDRSIEEHQVVSEAHPHPSRPPPQPPKVSTNPFHRAQSVERAPHTGWEPQDESSSDIWADLEGKTLPPAAEAPLDQQFGALRVDEQPERTPFRAVEPPQRAQVTRDVPLISFDQAEDYRREVGGSPFAPNNEQNPWEGREKELPGKGKGKEVILPPEAEQNPFQEFSTENSRPSQPSQPVFSQPAVDRKIFVPDDVAEKQRSETYSIKHIRWLDNSSPEVRTSPILIQNKNGPCPLLALVNALTLSTPLNTHTALIETLRVREQVSLGLLLDAVFDELMSGRRGDAAQELPDVAELYSFLITLHTGMNVNPRFVPARRREQSLVDGLENEVPLAMQDYRKPGTFEHTKEMLLYGTFSIPLMHGWIPPRSHQAFQSLERSAQSYEDAQNLLFREEELEDKLQNIGLSQDEQLMLEDIASIKFFLSSSATQLTGYGLDTIRESLKPGEIVILFRNDHFSTLYKHPRSGQLLHLVTDAGYSGHEEIVWESLVDVNGEGSDFFSGDFRPVGQNTGDASSQQHSFEQADQGNAGWTTVAKKGQNKAPAEAASEQFASHSTEQEDADLALAMQLQEEEEDRSRRSAAARKREDELSKAYLSSQNINTTHLNTNSASPSSSSPGHGVRNSPSSPQNVRPLLPPRRTNPQSNPRPPVHREANPDSADDEAPPSYDQAWKSEPYNGPPPDTNGPPNPIPPYAPSTSATSPAHSHPIRSSLAQLNGRPRGQSAYGMTNAGMPPQGQRRRSGAQTQSMAGSSEQDPSLQGIMRRRSAGVGSEAYRGRDKDCVVM